MMVDPGRKWTILSRYTIGPAEDPLITRYRIVQTPWFGVYVHQIHRPDADRDPHDHPWWFASWVLRGGYLEELHDHPERTWNPSAAVVKGRYRRPGSIHSMPLTRAHRIIFPQVKTLTLVIRGRYRQEWGFWTKTGWRPWRDYIADRGAAADPFDMP